MRSSAGQIVAAPQSTHVRRPGADRAAEGDVGIEARIVDVDRGSRGQHCRTACPEAPHLRSLAQRSARLRARCSTARAKHAAERPIEAQQRRRASPALRVGEKWSAFDCKAQVPPSGSLRGPAAVMKRKCEQRARERCAVMGSRFRLIVASNTGYAALRFCMCTAALVRRAQSPAIALLHRHERRDVQALLELPFEHRVRAHSPAARTHAARPRAYW